MRSTMQPMPSPNGTNHEGLYIRTRILTRAGMAYDSAAKDDADDLMKLRDALEAFLQDDLKLSPEAMAKFYEVFDKHLDVPVRAADKRKGYDNEHVMRDGPAERRAQAMDQALKGSSYSAFERRHPEVAHIKHT
jgi:hypothetical protein